MKESFLPCKFNPGSKPYIAPCKCVCVCMCESVCGCGWMLEKFVCVCDFMWVYVKSYISLKVAVKDAKNLFQSSVLHRIPQLKNMGIDL